jgi:CRP-like cAMP-binding protein
MRDRKEEMQALLAQAPEEIRRRFQHQTYPRGSQILPAQVPPECLYLIEAGVTEVFKESYSGAFISVNTFEAGTFFGEIELFCPELTPYRVTARTDCQLILIPKQTVFDWMGAQFAFTHFICETLARRLYFTSDSMSRIAMVHLKERVLGCIDIQYRAGTLGSFTKEMLVAQTRAPLRSVNRVVRECVQEGIIDYRKKAFTVLDEKTLALYAREYEI